VGLGKAPNFTVGFQPLFCPSRFSKSNAETTSVFIDEFDTSGFNGFLHFDLSIGRHPRPKTSFEPLHCWKRQLSSGGELRLRPAEKAPRSAELINCLQREFFLDPIWIIRYDPFGIVL
jgi:hypothetical protein